MKLQTLTSAASVLLATFRGVVSEKSASAIAKTIETLKSGLEADVAADAFDEEEIVDGAEKFHLRGSDAVELSGYCSTQYYSKGCSNLGGKCGARTGCYDNGPQRGWCDKSSLFSWKCNCFAEGQKCFTNDYFPDKTCCDTNENGEKLFCDVSTARSDNGEVYRCVTKSQ